MKCISCGREIEDAKFCPYCGIKQAQPETPVEQEPVQPVPVQETPVPETPLAQPSKKPKQELGLKAYVKNPFARTPLNGIAALVILIVNVIAAIVLIYAVTSSFTALIMNMIGGAMYGFEEEFSHPDIATYCVAGSVISLSSFVFFYLEEVVLAPKLIKDAFGKACGKLFLPTVLDVIAIVCFFVDMELGLLFTGLSALTKILAVSRIGNKEQNGYVSILMVLLYIAFIAVIFGVVFAG